MPHRFHIARIYRPGSSAPEPLKIALVLSGAVALGCFEAGVIDEILGTIQAGAPISLDLIVGSSAGALVGAMTAKCLVVGVPFQAVLPRWTEYTLQQLTSSYETPEQAKSRGHQLDRGILSSEAIRRILDDNLVADQVDRSFQPAYPAQRTALAITMTNLDGLPDVDTPQENHRFSEAVIFRFTPPDPHNPGLSPYPPAVWRRVALMCRASSAFPGAFDPEYVPWSERIRVPGLLEEFWENDALLERLHKLDPTLQPKMRYSDGGILDEHPVERAVTVLPLVTGGEGESGVETLVYDPHRCFLFIEPDPPATSLDALKAGTQQSWFTAFSRALQLWTLSAAPDTSQRRVGVANRRQEKLYQFLTNLARQMREEGQAPTIAQAASQFKELYPEFAMLGQNRSTLSGLGEPPGLIDPEAYKAAIQAFYAWLADDQRFKKDIGWLDGLPVGRLKDLHQSLRPVLLDLRDAYLSLEGMDPLDPHRYQNVLKDLHAELADSLGLSQPWVALQQLTPDDPKQMLKGEGIAHFGGFFSKEFLRHDYDVGRYYAYLWLREIVPEYVSPDGPPKPRETQEGLNLALFWQNRKPLWRMLGRFVGAVLELLGLAYDGGGQLLVRLLGWSLLLSMVHGLLLLTGAWLGWVTFPAQYEKLRFWLLLGTSVFPLTFGLLLGLTIKAGIVHGLQRERDRN